MGAAVRLGRQLFLTFPILPYKMGLELPNECIYTLGYYRPGDCSPYLFDPLPISVRGLFFETGTWVGGWRASARDGDSRGADSVVCSVCGTGSACRNRRHRAGGSRFLQND